MKPKAHAYDVDKYWGGCQRCPLPEGNAVHKPQPAPAQPRDQMGVVIYAASRFLDRREVA